MSTDWTKIYKKYKGLWVALKDDEITVIGSGQLLKDAMAQANKMGYKNPIAMRVPDNLSTYVGSL
ncbi:MAG: DUF5678 domain-containing protein [Candidatus Vogelbacteria bacterium]